MDADDQCWLCADPELGLTSLQSAAETWSVRGAPSFRGGDNDVSFSLSTASGLVLCHDEDGAVSLRAPADAASPADRWEAVMDGELSPGVAKEQGLFPQFDGAADAE